MFPTSYSGSNIGLIRGIRPTFDTCGRTINAYLMANDFKPVISKINFPLNGATFRSLRNNITGFDASRTVVTFFALLHGEQNVISVSPPESIIDRLSEQAAAPVSFTSKAIILTSTDDEEVFVVS